MKPTLIAASAVLSAILFAPLTAGTLIEGVSATASSWWDMPQVSRFQHPSNIVNNNGMASPYDITATHDPSGDAFDQWHAVAWADDPNPLLTFDLGGAFELEGLHIWNGNQTKLTGRGVDEFVLSVSTDGSNYTTVGTYNLSESTSDQPNTAQNFELAGNRGITHVQIRVNSTLDPSNNDYANLSEVMFSATPVPESFQVSRFELEGGKVTLAFPSVTGQVFDIYRSTDLLSGFDAPLETDIPAASGTTQFEGVIDNFDGGVTLEDYTADFDEALVPGTSYVFIPANGENQDREVEVLSWSGSSITLSEDLAADFSWGGAYEIRTPAPTETEWIDNSPPERKAFYRVQRR